MKRTAVVYNQAVNVFWSILNLLPISYFCAVELDRRRFFIFLIISLITAFLPRSFFDFIQLGKTTSIYHRLGIRTVRKFTQDGDWVNGALRKKFPRYKRIDKTVPLKKHLAKAYVNERFHFMVFVFFLLTLFFAWSRGRWGWGILLLLNNLVYNVFPILLQQYNRIRLRQLINSSDQDGIGSAARS